MRFIHTADWQIGMKAVHAAESAGTVRAARLESAKRVCELARRATADFLVLAGDTFENNAVDRNLVAEVAQILNSASCPAFVLPGNHDPLQPGSVWEHEAWRRTTNVTILRERRAVEIAGLSGFNHNKRTSLKPEISETSELCGPFRTSAWRRASAPQVPECFHVRRIADSILERICPKSPLDNPLHLNNNT